MLHFSIDLIGFQTMLNIAEEQNDFAFSHTTIKRLIDDPEGVDVVVTIPLFCEPIYYLAYKYVILKKGMPV